MSPSPSLSAERARLVANGSWWADCPDRETFNRRLQEELPRITRNELAWPTGSQSYAPEAA